MATGVEISQPLAGPTSFEMTRRAPVAALVGLVTDITGYREDAPGHFRQTEAASLVVPLVISFGDPFAIGLGRVPGGNDRYGSFAAGLFAGPVVIDSFGASNCVQINFTPLGARRFFGMPMSELTDRMIPLDGILGNEGTALRERLGNESEWQARFDLVEGFVRSRLARNVAPRTEVDWAYRCLTESQGRAKIASIAQSVGWSRKHLAKCFAENVGLGPKMLARIIRFNAALKFAQGGDENGWADISAACGYADQAHLTREFREFSGQTPTAWSARV
jgi:AraC-like DNA-binding protein